MAFLIMSALPAAALTTTDPSCEDREGPMIHVTVRGLESDKGRVFASLWRDADTFTDEGNELYMTSVPAQVDSVSLCFIVPEPGFYAVTASHDENDNGKYDRTWLGLPDEPFGISRDPKIGLRPPHLDEAGFDVPAGGIAIEITLDRSL